MADSTITVSRRDIIGLGQEAEEHTPCMLCKAPYVETGEKRIRLPCGHDIGRTCLYEWAFSNPPLQGSKLCPVCKAIFYIQGPQHAVDVKATEITCLANLLEKLKQTLAENDIMTLGTFCLALITVSYGLATFGAHKFNLLVLAGFSLLAVSEMMLWVDQHWTLQSKRSPNLSPSEKVYSTLRGCLSDASTLSALYLYFAAICGLSLGMLAALALLFFGLCVLAIAAAIVTSAVMYWLKSFV